MPAIVSRMLKSFSKDEDEFSQPVEFDIIPIGTNNSMPLADKPYDPPEVPEVIDAYLNGLGPAAKMNRETCRPVRLNYVHMYIRVRRRNYEQLLWQFLSTGVMKKEEIYNPECLPYWTVGLGIRLRNNYPMGGVMDAMKNRLGISNPGIRFCLDGFFGMVNYSDIFGNTADVCPWMEISNFSTVESLRLANGDSIFVSIASAGQIETVNNWRRKRALEAAAKLAQPDTKSESLVVLD